MSRTKQPDVVVLSQDYPEESETPPKPNPTIEMDPRGDLFIKGGVHGKDFVSDIQGHQLYRVCSATLARASPVFERMLFGHFNEARPAPYSWHPPLASWTVTLDDSYAEELTILLGLAHAQFQFIPSNPDPETIYKVAILADRYDLIRLLRPYAKPWATKLNYYLPNMTNPSWVVHVAWHLGNEALFLEATRKLCMESYVGFNNKLCWRRLVRAGGPPGHNNLEYASDGTYFDLAGFEHLGPPDLVEHLVRIRRNALKLLVQELNNELEQRERRAVYDGPRRCNLFNSTRSFCGYNVVDFILRTVRSRLPELTHRYYDDPELDLDEDPGEDNDQAPSPGHDPLYRAKDLHSPAEIIIDEAFEGLRRFQPEPGHEGCFNPETVFQPFDAYVDRTFRSGMANPEFPSQKHRQFMERQRAKLGYSKM